MADIIFVQSFVLKAFGFMEPSESDQKTIFAFPVSEAYKSYRKVLEKFVSCGLIVACSVMCLMEVTADVNTSLYVIDPMKNRNDPFLIRILSDLQFFFYPLRAVLVLSLFLTNRFKWTELRNDMQALINKYSGITNNPRLKTVSQLVLVSVCLSIVTFLLHGTFFGLQWFTNFDSRRQFHGSNYSVIIDHDYCYVFFCMNFIQATTLCTLTTFPAFFLSQQVLICPVIFAVFLLHVLRGVEDDIQNEIGLAKAIVVIDQDKWLAHLRTKLRVWNRTNVVAQQLVDQLNTAFTWIFLTSVGLDLVTALSLGAEIIQPRSDAPPVMYSVANCALFTSYATIFYSPFVMLHDKVRRHTWLEFELL